jgi:hypothetical protein
MQLPFSNDDMTLANLLKPYHPLSGHAVHTVEHLRALLFAAFMDGDPQYSTALQNALWKLEHYTLPSGVVIGDEGMHGLPLPEIGYEYCTMTELLFSLTSALQKTGLSKYGDWIESLAFNAAQGARFSDGTGVAYLSLDTRVSALYDRPDSYSHLLGKHGRFKYSPTHEDVACCCNPNSVRFLPHYISRMWMRYENEVAAATYGPCVLKTKINGVDVTISEETGYPFSDSIHFTISPSQPLDFKLALRKPAWSDSVTLAGAEAKERDAWLWVERKWEPGAEFTVTFHPRVEVTPYPNGEYAIRRGPFQYVYLIEHELHAIKDYPMEGFHDYEVTPRDVEQAYPFIFLDEADPDFSLRFGSDLEKETELYWDQPPVWLASGAHRLVPMGCTVLRRASFPMKRLQKENP